MWSSASGGTPRRLTTPPNEGDGHSGLGTANGCTSYQSAAVSGRFGRCLRRAEQAVQVTRTEKGVDTPQESPDGKFFYYISG